MTEFKTAQENFWAGPFGDAYIERNQGAKIVAGNIVLFSHLLSRTREVNSVLELGANIGLNLHAVHSLLPEAQLHAVEINKRAAAYLREMPFIASVNDCSILEYFPTQSFDLVFSKGVLIHLDPMVLPDIYDLMVAASKRYLLLAEYYNPIPQEIPYRGNRDRLYKRDFAGELMDRHPQMQLLDYGFRYRRDPNWPLNDITWFLMEKT